MKRQTGLLLFILLLTACSPDRDKGNLTNIETSSTIKAPTPTPSYLTSEETVELPSNKTWEEEVEDTKEQRKRKGDINLETMEVIGVKDELLETIMMIFEALNNQDEEARLQLLFDPVTHNEFGHDGLFILAITKLELDNTRRDDVSSEYGLNKVASEVAIVKITRKTLTTKLTESISTGDYIFIKTKTDQRWKLYRSQ